MATTTRPLNGKDRILFWRKLKDEKTNKGRKMLYQTEHEKTYSADSDEVNTKDGALTTSKSVSDEIQIKAIAALGDEVVTWLEDAMLAGDVLEMWEVDISQVNAGKCPAEYRQGILTELKYKANAEDHLEIEGTYKTNGTRQKGEVTLTPDEQAVIQYAFRDLDTVKEA